MKYRKKPVIIEAVQLVGTAQGIKKVVEFMGEKVCLDVFGEQMFERYCDSVIKEGLKLKTLESDNQTQTADIGDFIIKGVHGEFYPCKPDIFELTYEAV